MKTQRRHELQTNALADWLGHQIENIRPYAKTILAIVIACVAVIAAYLYMSRAQRAQAQEGWSAFHAAITSGEAEQLREVARLYGHTPPGLWAQLSAADLELNQGIVNLFRDHELAERRIEQAQRDYQAVANAADKGSLLEQRARFGLAQAYESLGNLQEARKHYEQAARGDSAVAQEAKKRLELTQETDVEELYKALANYVPQQREALQTPSSLFDPEAPLNLDDLPNTPDLNLPQQLPSSVAPATAIQPVEPQAPQGEAASGEAGIAEPADNPAAQQPPQPEQESASPAEQALPLQAPSSQEPAPDQQQGQLELEAPAQP